MAPTALPLPTATMPQPRRRLASYATAFVILVCLSIIAIEAWRIVATYRNQLNEGEIAATNLSRALADHAAGVFAQADTLLVAIVERFEEDGATPDNVASIHRLLVREMTELPQMQRLSILDADSRWMTTDLEDVDSHVLHADREYFQFHRDHPSAIPHLGPPIRSKTTDQWIVTISRRFNHRDGSFGGVVLASIDLAFFSEYYKQFDIGSDGSIALLSGSGTLLNRRPFREDLIGTSFAKAPLFRDHIAYDPAGSAWLKSAVDGVQRLTAFQRTGSFPAYAIVALSKHEMLQDWIADSIIHGIATLVLVVAIGWIGRRLIQQIEKRAQDQLALMQSRKTLEVLNRQLETLAREDALTALPNRREFDRVLADEAKRIARTGGSLAMIMLDVDRFKAYNDYFGHPKGDVCLRAIADRIAERVGRSGDFAARYGGEEFVIVLPSTDVLGARAVAEKLRIAIHALALPHPRNPSGIVTVSMGIGTVRAGEVDALGEELLQRADKALYAAKAMGRDAIRVEDGAGSDVGSRINAADQALVTA